MGRVLSLIVVVLLFVIVWYAINFSEQQEFPVLEVSKFREYIVVPVEGSGIYRLLLPSSEFNDADVNTLHVGVLYNGRVVEVPSFYRAVDDGFELWFYVPEDNISQVFLFLGPEDNEENPMNYRGVFKPELIGEVNIPICHYNNPDYTLERKFGGGVDRAARYDPRTGEITIALGEYIYASGYSCNAKVRLVVLDANTLDVEHNACIQGCSICCFYGIKIRAVAQDPNDPNIIYFGSSRVMDVSTYPDASYDFDVIIRFTDINNYDLDVFNYSIVRQYKRQTTCHVSTDNYHFVFFMNVYGTGLINRYNSGSYYYNAAWSYDFSTNCSRDIRENDVVDAWCNSSYCWLMVRTFYCPNSTTGYEEYYLGRMSINGSVPQKLVKVRGSLGQLYGDGTIYFDRIKILGDRYYTNLDVFGFWVYEPWIGAGKVYIDGKLIYTQGIGYVFGSDGNYFYSLVPEKEYKHLRLIKWTYNIKSLEGISFERKKVIQIPVLIEERNQLYTHVFVSGYIDDVGEFNVSVYIDNNYVYSTNTTNVFEFSFDVNGIEANTYHLMSVYVVKDGIQVGSYEYNAYFGIIIPNDLPDKLNGYVGREIHVPVLVYASPGDKLLLVFEQNDQNIVISPACKQVSDGLAECEGTATLIYSEPGVYEVSVYGLIEHNGEDYLVYMGDIDVYVSSRAVSFGAVSSPVQEVQEEQLQSKIGYAVGAQQASPLAGFGATLVGLLLVIVLGIIFVHSISRGR